LGIFERKKTTMRSSSDESLQVTEAKDGSFGKDHSAATTTLAENTQTSKPQNDDPSRRSSGTGKRLMRRLSGSFHDASSTRNVFVRSSELQNVTLEHVPDLLLDLESAVSTSAERPKRALRMLFALSKQRFHRNRIEMVHRPHEQQQEDRSLVPTLLQFLNRCQPNSNEQHMALLVLNNISIPLENKRVSRWSHHFYHRLSARLHLTFRDPSQVIALDRGGAKILARLLCEEPSCHLLAIILVNLTFAGIDLRRQLLNDDPTTPSSKNRKHERNNNRDTLDQFAPVALVESLAFALRVATLTKEEHQDRMATIEECCENANETYTTADRLSILMAEDQRLRQQDGPQHRHASVISPMTPPSHQLYPDTARWCLAALRNLTRPCESANAAHILVQSSAFSMILQFISIFDRDGEPVNEPQFWDSNSVQDTALSIIMNLSACPLSREYTNETQTIKVLSTITKYPERTETMEILDEPQRKQMNFQCLKAVRSLRFQRLCGFLKCSLLFLHCLSPSYPTVVDCTCFTEDDSVVFDWVRGTFRSIETPFLCFNRRC
jgi:hypothetical protein